MDTAPGGEPQRPGRRSLRILIPVIALGLAGTVLAGIGLRRTDEDRRDRALGQQTAIVAQALTAEMRRYSTSLLDLAAAVGAQGHLETAEFTAITAATDRQRLPGATGVAFVVPASTAQIPVVQRTWRAEGSPDLLLRAAPGTGGEHLFVVLNRAIDGTDSAAGQDLAASAATTEALHQARATHGVTTSATHVLLKDAGLPAGAQQLSFVLAAPVYATSPAAPDPGQFRGWLVMGLRAGDFLHEAISLTAGDAVAVTLSDTSAGGVTPVGHWLPAAGVDRARPARIVPIVVPQRTWQLTVAPTDRLLPGADLHLELVAWIVGGLITALLAALTGTVLTSRNRALRQVETATATLRRDIAHREAVELQLRQREAELIGFAGIVAHDLRSPLARISGYAGFLREEATARLEPVHQDFLERLYGGVLRMQSLIDDLLGYATAENRILSTGQVDLNRLVAEVVRDRVNGQDKLQPKIIVWPLPRVEGDFGLLRQVVDNLIGNALKYTPDGEDPSIEITSHPEPGGGYRIEVADRGIGVPQDQRETVFTAFTRADGSARYDGTGLGLAIVQRIIERHGGRVGVDANPGGGSRFWFTLPGSY